MRAATHSYQLHGGVILVPTPQHHAHLTSRRGGKGERKRGKNGGRGVKHLPARPGRSGRLVRSRLSAPDPSGHPWSPGPPHPRQKLLSRAGTLPRSPALALPGSRASLARSPPASTPPPNQTTPPASERPRFVARGPLGPRRRGVRAGGLSAPSPARRPPGLALSATTDQLATAWGGRMRRKGQKRLEGGGT